MENFEPQLLKMVRLNEGVRNKVYNDSLGIPTVGVGLNLLRPDAKAALKAVGANYDSILAGKSVLTDAQIDSLLAADLQDSINDLKTIFTDFDSFPTDAKLVIIDMRFNLGPTRFRGFGNSIKDMKNHDWKSAAERLKQSVWFVQTGKRAQRSVAMLQAILQAS